MLLDYDGYDDMTEEDVAACHNVLEEVTEERWRGSRNSAGVAGVRSRHRHDRYNVDGNGVGGEYLYANDEEEAREYHRRRDALIEHYMFMRENVL